MYARFFQSVAKVISGCKKSYTVEFNETPKEQSQDYTIVTLPNNENYKDAFQMAMIGSLKVHPLANKYQIRDHNKLGWNITLKLNASNEVVGEAIRARDNILFNIKVVFSPDDTKKILSIMNDEYLVKLEYRNNFRM